MRLVGKILVLLALLGSAYSQDAEPKPEAPKPETPEPEAPQKLEIRVLATHKDWNIREERLGEHVRRYLHQVGKDSEGRPASELRVLLPPEGEDVAAAFIAISPLQTHLPSGLKMKVDRGKTRTHPYTYAMQQGTFVISGFSSTELQELKRGAKLTVSYVLISRPDQPVSVEYSLAGFTAAFSDLAAKQSP